MSTSITFDVVGSPAAQGSKKLVNAVASAARCAAERDDVHAPLDGPLHLEVLFRFPMPKARPSAVRAAGHGPKVTAPDLDKLVRSVGDALQQGGLVADDARICSLNASKTEVVGWTGAVITVQALPAGPLDTPGRTP